MVFRERADGGAAGAESEPRAGRLVLARPGPLPYVWAALAIALTTAAGFVVKGLSGTEELVMLYLLAIMIVALRFHRGPAFLSATLSVAAFDFFFVPPAFTFAVKDPRQLLTFGVMFAVGLVISTLTVQLKREEEASRVREARTNLLYELGRELGGARDEATVAEMACRHLSLALASDVWLFVRNGDECPTQASRSGDRDLGTEELAVVTGAFDRPRAPGAAFEARSRHGIVAFPLMSREKVRGVFAVHDGEATALEPTQASLLESVARQVGTELDRMRLAHEAEDAALRARTEELRSALLSAVSHDLRTPLAAITGAATMLRDDRDLLPLSHAPISSNRCATRPSVSRGSSPTSST